MSVLLVGKPELAVGFSMHKLASDQPTIDTWENRFGSGGDSQPRPTIDKTSPPPLEPSSTDDPDYNCGDGMCARSQATSTTTCATMTSTMTTSSSVVVTTATTATENSDRSDPQPPSQRPESPLSPKPHANSVISSTKATTPTTIMDIAIRCTAPSCPCDGFHPGKPHIRSCDSCQHGWVAHALDKLGFRHLYGCHQVELVQASTAFDVASLMLYGTEALPIRLKILLDRLFSVLQREEVVHVLHGFGWTYEDYMRGYILQNARGHVLERWTMPSREEEPLILQQFLRFGETKPIAQQLLLQDVPDQLHLSNLRNYSESDFKRYIQRSSRAAPGIASVAPFTLGPRPSKAATPTSAVTPAVSPLTPTTCVSILPSGQMPPQAARANRPPSNVSSTASSSPTTSSPINSPLSSSPLNKLQNMQPYDYRRERHSPDTRLTGHPPIISFSHQGPSPLRSPTATSASMVSFSSQVANAVSTSYMMSTNTSRLLAPSDLSATDEGSGNDTDSGAINLSQHHSEMSLGPGHHPHLDSIFAAKKIRHLRKSANPMKRRWNPMMLSNLTTNPTTGKKRVQCHVCLKTFCDKGALKIHFSAVHLREMHKCTVDGCNMMFSSRRSRNRHSANPNPKLHTPNLRRKISHHDGRSSLPYPLIPSSASLVNFNNNGNGNLLSLPPSLHQSLSQEVESVDRSMFINENNIKTELTNNTPSNIVNDSPNNRMGHHQLNSLTLSDDGGQISKKPRYELNGEVSNEGEAGMDLTVVKNNPSENDSQKNPIQNKGVRKRKSFNPTKCTAASEDDDLQYVSTDDDDDSSSDTCVDDNGLLSKSDEFSSDLLEDDSKDDIMDKDSSSTPLPTSLPTTTSSSHIPSTSSFKFLIPPVTVHSQTLAPTVERHDSKTTSVLSFAANNFRAELLTAKDVDNYTLDLSSKHRDPVIKPIPEVEEVSESPLRHLETLSLGAFTGLLNHTKSTFGQHLSSTPASTGISFHAPGLGLASSGPPPPIPSDPLSRGEKGHRITSEPPPISIPIPGCGGLSVGDSDTDGAIQMLPMYRDASMMSAVDVPVDKENPRRCIACGKIFQNHFGVKTHYQNVHLKLMHKCTVEGCNAAFPSKRSRDRHSANLNLHRKLLSTSADKAHFFEKGLFPYQHPGNPLRDDYFSRIYDPQSLPLNFADFYHGRLPEGFLSSSPFGSPLGMSGPLSLMPNFHPAFMVPTSGSSLHDGGNNTVSLDGREDTPLSSISSTPSPGLRSPGSQSSSGKDRSRTSGRIPLSLDSELTPDSDGRFPCNFCQRLFADASHLKDHYEGTHLPSLLPCPSEDCHKVFLTKPDKDKHCSQHDHGIHRVRRESPSVS